MNHAEPSPSNGGVLVAFVAAERERLAFVPASSALRMASLSRVTAVPGLARPALGIAIADGEVVTVLEIGAPPEVRPAAYSDWPTPGSDRAVVCTIRGQQVALTGGRVVATGVFERGEAGGVVWRGEQVAELDVDALYDQAQAAVWSVRMGRSVVGGGAA